MPSTISRLGMVCWVALGDDSGIKGASLSHCAFVRSDGYRFLAIHALICSDSLLIALAVLCFLLSVYPWLYVPLTTHS